MNYKHALFFTFFITTALCAKKKQPEHVPYLRPLTSYIDYQETENNITLWAKQLSLDDCKPLFGDRAKLLFKKKRRRQPIYPIQLSITNHGENPIVLKPEQISLTLTPYKEVAHRLEHNALLHVIGGIAVALVTTGLLIGGIAFSFASWGISTALFGSIGATVSAPLLIAGLSAAVVTPFFVVIGTPVVSTMKGMKTYHKNTIIKHALYDKSLKSGLRINPGQTIDTLLFVSKANLQSSFSVSLAEYKSYKELATFNVEFQSDL